MTVQFSHDHSGLWMSAVKDRGVDTSVLFGRLDMDGDGEPCWYSLWHSDFDGIGAFARLLREDGHADLQALPQSQSGACPSLVKLLLAGARFTTFLLWRGGSAVLAARVSAPQTRKVAWHVFDRERTRALAARAKREGVSVN